MSLLRNVRNRTRSQYAANRIASRFAPSQTTHAATVAGHNLVIIDGRTVPAAGVDAADTGSPIAIVNAGSAGLAAYSAQGAGIAVQFAGGTGTGGSGGGMEVHDLNSVWHTGTIADAQAPQFLKLDGTRQLTGNLTVAAGITIDGIDIGNPGEGLTTSANRYALNPSIAGAGLSYASGVMAVGVATTINASGAGAGLSAETDLVRLTASSNPGITASILATNASGQLQLEELYVDGYVVLSTADAGLIIADRADYANVAKRWVIYSYNDLHLYRNAVNHFTFADTGSITTSAHMTLAPTGDAIIDPATNLAKMAPGVSLQADNYASQLTGWRVTYDGQADFRYIYTDELHAKSFIADLEQALAGGQIISKSVAQLAWPFAVPAAGAWEFIYVKDLPSAPNMAVFQAGDIIRLRTFDRSGGGLTIADCWGTVTNYVDGNSGNFGEDWQGWTFTRSAAPNAGAMAAGTVIQPDAIILDYGTSGNGFHEVNAIDGLYGANSPYSQIVTWSGHPATGQTLRTRMGNLYGLFSVANEYGLFAGNGTANSDPYLRISNNAVRLNNIPLTLYNGATQTVNISATGTDIWVGPSSSDKRLSWDGSTLTVNGAINVTGGNAATQTYASSAASTAQTNAQSYTDSTAANKALSNVTRELVSTTLITGGNIRVGSGTKDSTLDGWHIDIGEIVGQLDGVDQVTMGTDGKIKAGAGAVTLSRSGIAIEARTGSAFNPDPKNRIDFLTYGSTSSMGYIGASENLGAQYLEILQSTIAGGSANLNIEAKSGASWPATITIKARNDNLGLLKTLEWSATSAAPTYANNALWHAGNDGSGSGLDADKLDTYEGSAFGRIAADQSWTGQNTFQSSAYNPIVVYLNASGSGRGLLLQTAGSLNTSTNNDYMALWHYGDNVMAIAAADTNAWQTLFLQPYGGSVLVGSDIIMNNNQAEKFIRSSVAGGAIRLRGNGAATTDRGLYFGGIDNNGTWHETARIPHDSNCLMVGNTSDLYSAAIQTGGNIHAAGAITAEEYFQGKYRDTDPAQANNFWRLYLKDVGSGRFEFRLRFLNFDGTVSIDTPIFKNY